MKEIIENTFSNIFITLAKDFISSHFLSQPPQILGADNVEPIVVVYLSPNNLLFIVKKTKTRLR